MDNADRTDYEYEPYGEPEDWTLDGMKVYHYGWKFNSDLDFVETFCTEDGKDWIRITEKKDWTQEIWKIAEDHYYI